MVKGLGGFVGGSTFKSQWGQKFTYKKKIKILWFEGLRMTDG